MSFVEALFLVSFFLPPAVVVLGGILLLVPGRHRTASVSVFHAHAH